MKELRTGTRPPDGESLDRESGREFALRVSIVGAAVEDGEIDAAAFGAALVPLARLVERVSEITTGRRLAPQIADQFERGSFVFVLTPPKSLAELALWFTTTKALLDLIGMPTGKDGGIRGVIKWWRQAKLPERTRVLELPPTGPDPVEIAAHDYDVVRLIAEFAKLLKSQGIDEIQFSSNDLVEASIDKSDVRALDALRKLAPSTRIAVSAAQSVAALPPAEVVTEQTFEIVSAGLSPDAQWVLRSEEDGQFQAFMHDHDFRDQISSRRIVFGRGDRIRATVSTIRWSGARRPGLSRRILTVIEFIPAGPSAHEA
jgi:hypothetical protein